MIDRTPSLSNNRLKNKTQTLKTNKWKKTNLLQNPIDRKVSKLSNVHESGNLGDLNNIIPRNMGGLYLYM